MNILNNQNSDLILLNAFNDRDIEAFSDIYNMFYTELSYYARRLYFNTTVSADDCVQDIFIKLWEKKDIRFSEIIKIKSYLYASIRNRFIDHLSHTQCTTKFHKKQLENPNYNITQMVESETLSILSQAIDMLPEECARVFQLHLEGWSVKDIAKKLGKAPSTIYTQKQDAIKLLKKRFGPDKLLLLMLIFKG